MAIKHPIAFQLAARRVLLVVWAPLNSCACTQVLQSVPTCPNSPQLQHTSCTLMRKFAPWLAASGLEQPELLRDLVPPLFKHAVGALSTNLSAGGGSLAFAELCRLCAPTIAQHCRDTMIATFDAAVASETWRGREAKGRGDADGRSAPAAGPLEEEDVCSIIEGTSCVLAHEASQGSQEVRVHIASTLTCQLRS